MSNKLTAWRVPTGVAFLDHTYVTASNGDTWGCYGRDNGGKELFTVDADLKVAKCLGSGFEGDQGILDMAKGLYGITYVCHQAANRVLRGTRKTVKECNGYNASWLAYGAYGFTGRLSPAGTSLIGVTAWAMHKTKCLPWSEVFKPDPVRLMLGNVQYVHIDPEEVLSLNEKEELKLHHEAVSPKEYSNNILKEETKIMLQSHLGNTFNNNKIQSIINSRTDFIERNVGRSLELYNNAKYDEYAVQIEDDFSCLLRSVKQTLTDKEYSDFFGIHPDNSINLIDPNAIKQMQKKR